MKKILVLFVMAFGLMSFSESPSATADSNVLEELNYTSFDVELNFDEEEAFELYCTATVTRNGQYVTHFTYPASTSGGLANACQRARQAAADFIAVQP